VSASDVVELTRRLVALPTAGAGEGAAAALAAEVLAAAGWTVRLLPLAAGREQVLAVLGDPVPGALCLCGHVDTVPVGDEAWTRDPHGGEVAGGRLYGRGASDMKGGVAAVVTAAARMARGSPRPDGTIVALTAAEETGCEGARALAGEPEFETLAASSSPNLRATASSSATAARCGSSCALAGVPPMPRCPRPVTTR
jgi:succinyl-diaminopimelate desuccinylase